MKNVYKAKFLTPIPQIFRLLLDSIFKKSKYRPNVPKTPFEKNCVLII
jgi:hypothetical protein